MKRTSLKRLDSHSSMADDYIDAALRRPMFTVLDEDFRRYFSEARSAKDD